MRKKDIISLVKRQWILIWLIVVSLALVTVLSFAAYKNANYKIKRVVAPAAGTDGLFTSNYLALGSNNVKPAYFQNTPYEYDVIIRNYNPVDPYKIYNGTITYTLSVELVHNNERSYDPDNNTEDAEKLQSLTNTGGSITVSLGNSNSFTLDATNRSHVFGSRTLTEDDGTDTWHVSYTGIDLDSDYCVKFIAHANNVDLEDIYATVIVASYPTVRPQGWTCVLNESGSDKNVGDYDGFNYTISGTGAKNLKFSYDASKLAVNPACYQFDVNNDVANPTTYSGSGTGSKYSTWKTIVITADPDHTFVNQYDLQLYKIGSYSPTTYDAIDPNKTNAFVEFE